MGCFGSRMGLCEMDQRLLKLGIQAFELDADGVLPQAVQQLGSPLDHAARHIGLVFKRYEQPHWSTGSEQLVRAEERAALADVLDEHVGRLAALQSDSPGKACGDTLVLAQVVQHLAKVVYDLSGNLQGSLRIDRRKRLPAHAA